MYETSLVPPGGTAAAGLAWMDTTPARGAAVLGFHEPGGGPYTLTAPVQPAQAASLVAAFNGGFLMRTPRAATTREGRAVYPLVDGAASLVIYSDGSVTVGAWGSDVSMTPDVVAVRQNLVPLVEDGQPTAQAANADWHVWGRHLRGDLVLVDGARTGVPVAFERRRHRRRRSRVRRGAGPQTRRSWLTCSCAPGWCGAWSSTSTRAGRSSPRYDPPPPRSSPRPRTGTACSRQRPGPLDLLRRRPGPATS